MHSADERQIAPPVEQILHPLIHSHQRGGARGIDRVIRPHEIEPIGDAPAHHVGYQRRCHLGVERRQARLQLPLEQVQLVVGMFRMKLLEDVQNAVDDYAVLKDGRKAPVDIGASPDHHLGPGPVESAVEAPCVGEGLVRDLQREKLVRLAAVDGRRHDAVGKRIETGQLSQITAALAVNPVVLIRCRVVVQLRLPIVRRIADGVDFVDNVLPVRPDVRCLRKQAGHADDGNVVLRRTVRRHDLGTRRLHDCGYVS